MDGVAHTNRSFRDCQKYEATLTRCLISFRSVVHSYQMYRYVQIFRRLGRVQREVEGKTINALTTELGSWACRTLCSL